MKLLVFSNLFPPLFIGGYELGAAMVVRELRRRGHEVLVLTAHSYRIQRPDGYRRYFHTAADRRHLVDVGLCVFGSFSDLFRWDKGDWLRSVASTVSARSRYREHLHRFRPDRLLAFNPFGVVAPVLDDCSDYARQAGVPFHAYVSDQWLAEWPFASPVGCVLDRRRRSRRGSVRLAAQLATRVLQTVGYEKSPLPQVGRYHFCSAYVARVSRHHVASGTDTDVVHWGLEGVESRAIAPPAHFLDADPLTILYAGQIIEHKGLTVLLQALARCRRPHPLVVMGDDATPHAAECKRLADTLRLTERVRFVGRVRPDEMSRLLASAGHVLVVPSVWDEPFSIGVLEGMAAGLPVVASATGGTSEALTDGVSGFLFERGNPDQLAGILNQLEADRMLCRRVGSRARSLIRERFTMKAMVDQLLNNSARGEE